jgi:hypothetical protein
MPAHKDLTSPAHAFTAADYAIPLVAERNMMTLTARRFFSISFLPGSLIERIVLFVEDNQQES